MLSQHGLSCRTCGLDYMTEIIRLKVKRIVEPFKKNMLIFLNS